MLGRPLPRTSAVTRVFDALSGARLTRRTFNDINRHSSLSSRTARTAAGARNCWLRALNLCSGQDLLASGRRRTTRNETPHLCAAARAGAWRRARKRGRTDRSHRRFLQRQDRHHRRERRRRRPDRSRLPRGGEISVAAHPRQSDHRRAQHAGRRPRADVELHVHAGRQGRHLYRRRGQQHPDPSGDRRPRRALRRRQVHLARLDRLRQPDDHGVAHRRLQDDQGRVRARAAHRHRPASAPAPTSTPTR